MRVFIEMCAAVCYNLSVSPVNVKSYAKINLTLDIKGVSGGYHMIDSLVASVDLCDVITAKKRRDGLITVNMRGEGSEYIPLEQNAAVKAGELFVRKFGTCGADITVKKNIPIGAGLGGSSADVSGVLNAMAKLYAVEDGQAIKEIADGLGSDCGYMLGGGYARITGRGEKVRRIDCNLRPYVGILIPTRRISTAACYRVSDRTGTAPCTSDRAEEALRGGDLNALGASLSNGLYNAATTIYGGVKTAYEELKDFDPLGVNMTGSGSGVYAIFENEQFLRYAQSRYRGSFRFITARIIIPRGEDR